MKYMMGLALMLAASVSYADFEVCSGKVKSLLVRDSQEGTQVTLTLNSGETTGRARIGGFKKLPGFLYGGPISEAKTYNDNQLLQIDLLRDAIKNDLTVFVELETDGYTFNGCNDFEYGLPVRYVAIGNPFRD